MMRIIAWVRQPERQDTTHARRVILKCFFDNYYSWFLDGHTMKYIYSRSSSSSSWNWIVEERSGPVRMSIGELAGQDRTDQGPRYSIRRRWSRGRRGVQISSHLVMRSTKDGRQQPLIPIIHFHPHFHSPAPPAQVYE